MTSIPLGKFIWHELVTTDVEAAQAFYTEVVGWGLMPNDMNDMPYTLLSVEGTGIAGMMTMPPEAAALGARPCWMGYVGVPDTDATLAKAQELGGRVYRPATDIPGVGRFAVIGDPHGAALCLMTPHREAAPHWPALNTPGMVAWNELMAGELEAAFAFYAALFGWVKGEAMDMGPMGLYQIFGTPGATTDGTPAGCEMLGGMMTKPPMLPMAFWQYYIRVESIAAAKTRLEGAGGTVLMGPMEVPGGDWIVNALEPQGVAFSLVGPQG